MQEALSQNRLVTFEIASSNTLGFDAFYDEIYVLSDLFYGNIGTMKAIEIENLVKVYGTNVKALKGVSLSVEEGDFYALLGPNGAGKSTTIGIISSLVNKTSGKVKIFGFDLDTQLVEAKKCLGLVPQEFNFNQFEKVEQIVVNQAGYYGVERKEAKIRAQKYLSMLDLWDKRNEPARDLSGGMKRRLMIARALMHEPKQIGRAHV